MPPACSRPPHVAQAASDPGHPSCDLVSLDGGHTFAAAMGDIIHMRQMASKDFAVFVMNNVYCEGAAGGGDQDEEQQQQRRQLQQQQELQDHCQGPTAALEAAVRHGLVEVVKVGADGWPTVGTPGMLLVCAVLSSGVAQSPGSASLCACIFYVNLAQCEEAVPYSGVRSRMPNQAHPP